MASQKELLPASGFFEAGEHLFPVRIYYEDTDLSGIVYHANYLRYMERARSDMLRVAGIDQRDALETGIGHYAVAEIAIRYRAPARLDDALTVHSRVQEVTAARCVLSQSVRRGEAHLADADVTVAFVDPSGRPRRQPAHWVDIFRALAPSLT